MPKHFDVKYAVSLYGILQDTYKDNDSSIKAAGLTFGPATGKSYVDAYTSHTPTGLTASGNPHRCIHDDDWESIVYWSQKDPYVYEQCIDGGGSGESCTKSVPIILSDKIKAKSYPNMTGDGAGVLYRSIKLDYRKWNMDNTNNGGWPASRIRSTLNGKQPEMTETAWENTEDELCTEVNCLFAGFPAKLKEAIVPKAVKSDTAYNDTSGHNVVTYDKLWLLSGAETLVDYGSNNSVIRPNEGIPYERVTTLGITMSNYSKNKGYYEFGSASSRWLRSASRSNSCYAYKVYNSGDWNDYYVSDDSGLAPGFCLR